MWNYKRISKFIPIYGIFTSGMREFYNREQHTGMGLLMEMHHSIIIITILCTIYIITH